jgi:peptidyl-tRNA hydrolase, PTH1 family
MKMVVGLGNPEKKHSKNRHNVGFILLDRFADAHGLTWKTDKKAQALVTNYDGILLVKPQTYMNRSGISVSWLVNFYKINLNNLLVMHDELDLPFGEIKVQKDIGPAGHRGVEDIVVALKTKEFWRFRVGIGRPSNSAIPIEDWVLSDFSPQELEKLQDVPLPIAGS